ncbi:MAG: hypothetical protein HUU32_10970 [Calditrichaceae bacterium]|nr:hypothetical protein [Calditrichia bacterium]NUQ41907.1 hypothetical protein [Calditrichaceae bacterium]
MMQTLWNWIIDNYQWLFGGAGAMFIGFALKKIFFHRKTSPAATPTGDRIETKGDFSPGKVGGDYNVTIHEPPRPQPPKKA